MSDQHEEKEPEIFTLPLGGERSEIIISQVHEVMATRKEMLKLKRKMDELNAQFTAQSKKMWGQIYDWHEDLDLTNPNIHSTLVGPDDKKLTECKEGEEITLKYYTCQHDHSHDSNFLKNILRGLGGIGDGPDMGGIELI